VTASRRPPPIFLLDTTGAAYTMVLALFPRLAGRASIN